MSSPLIAPPITVFSKPACVQCTATQRALDAQGLAYTVIDLTQDTDALEMVQGMGYRQAPVVMYGDQHWSGYRPDLLQAASRRASAA